MILFDLGRELNLIKRHFVFKNRVPFFKKSVYSRTRLTS